MVVSPARTLVSYLAPDRPSRRLDLDRFTDETSILRNALGGKVTRAGMSRYLWCAGTFSDRCVPDPFTYADVHPHDLTQVFDQHGVCVRAGHHCAKVLMRELGVTATARASLYVYNDEADVDALAEAIAAAAAFFAV